MTDRTGRQPQPAGAVVLRPVGPHRPGERAAAGSRARGGRALRDGDAPVSAVETHMRYLPCGVHRGVARRREGARRVLPLAGPADDRLLQPGDLPGLPRGVRRGRAPRRPHEERGRRAVRLLRRTSATARRRRRRWARSTSPRPARRSFWDGLMNQAVEDGKDGWMEDFGEYTPPDSVHAERPAGQPDAQPLPGRLPLRRLGVRAPAPRPIARHVRSGWTGAARCSQIVWGGDPTTAWGFDGLDSAIKNGLTMGLSGVSVWGSDIGGFFALGRQPADARAARPLGAVRRGVRGDAHQARRRRDPARRSARRSTTASRLPNWRRWAKFRTQIYPYMAGRDREYARHGHADHAPPGAGLPGRREGAAPGARVHVRPRPAGRAGASSRARASATLYLPGRALGRHVARRWTTTHGRGGLRAAAAHGRSPAAAT